MSPNHLRILEYLQTSFTCLLESEDSPSSSEGFSGTPLPCPCASFFCWKRAGQNRLSQELPCHLPSWH